MTDTLHIRGRWVTMTTASRCVHHVSLADSCAPCGLTGKLEDFSDEVLLAECDRRRLFMPVVVEPVSEPLSPDERAAILAKGGTGATMVQLADDLKANFAWVGTEQLPDSKVLEKPTPPERPAKKGRK